MKINDKVRVVNDPYNEDLVGQEGVIAGINTKDVSGTEILDEPIYKVRFKTTLSAPMMRLAAVNRTAWYSENELEII
jgi:hypothetical protein